MTTFNKSINKSLTSSQLLSTQKKNNNHIIYKNINNYQQLDNNCIKEIKLGINNNSNFDLKAFRINVDGLRNTFSIFYFDLLNNKTNINFNNPEDLENLRGKIYFKYNDINSYLKINDSIQNISFHNEMFATIFELEYCQDTKGFYIKIFNHLKDFCYLTINKDGKINFLNKETLQFGYIFRDKREIHKFMIS